MKIDTDKKQRIAEFLNSKVGSPKPCPVCGKTRWTLGDDVWELRQLSKDGLRVGGSLYPVILLICNECGNTQFLNAVVVGAVDQKGGEGADANR